MRVFNIILLALLLAPAAKSQQWENLLDGKDLNGWEVRGEGVWTVLPNGTLLGQRLHASPANPFDDLWPITQKQYHAWEGRQAWLYTKREFGDFDLHLEYLIPPHENSGVSIRDESRAHWVIGEPNSVWTPNNTTLHGSPAHVGYEIQIIDGDAGRYPSGSVYLFAAAKRGVQKSDAWNSMDIESRSDMIRVKLNGELVAESPGDPERSKVGPIGLQLHDQFTFVMFRNIRIRPLSAASAARK